MGWFDIVLRQPSHEISGHIAMQHSQFNFVGYGIRCLAFMMTIGTPALAGTNADRLLDSGSTVSCAAGTDYAEGIDVNGNPVVPADLGGGPVPVPDFVTIPLARASANTPSGPGSAGSIPGNKAYVRLEGKKLQSLLNPSRCH
jgi:hypothetical protein